MSCLIRLSESCIVDRVDSGKSMVVVFVFLGPSMTAIKIMFEVGGLSSLCQESKVSKLEKTEKN